MLKGLRAQCILVLRQGYEISITIYTYLFEEQKAGDGKKNLVAGI